MKKKRFLSLILVTLCLVSTLSTFEVKASALGVSASGACLMNIDGRVLYEKNADVRMSMASTTKIMTAIVVIETLELQRQVKVADAAIGVEGSSMYLQKGETVSVKDLLYALLLQSANDAAVALACETAGTVEAFAELMNRKASELGLKNTHFTNPHGLDDEAHYTTARELAMIAAYAMKNATFAEITSTVKYTYSTDLRKGVFVNHNKLLYMLKDCVGIKTGYTKKTGRCLVSAVNKDGLVLIAVTLNAPDDWNDHMRMHEYGQSQYEFRQMLEDREFVCTLPVINGENPEITLANTGELSAWLVKDQDAEVVTELPRFLYAPIEEGEICGAICIYRDGSLVQSIDIIALEGSESIRYYTWYEKLFNKIKEIAKSIFNG